MLMPNSAVTVPSRRPQAPGEESFTEDYGDTLQNARDAMGGVDFFSSLGTEVKKKRPLLDRPEATLVRIHVPNPPQIAANQIINCPAQS